MSEYASKECIDGRRIPWEQRLLQGLLLGLRPLLRPDRLVLRYLLWLIYAVAQLRKARPWRLAVTRNLMMRCGRSYNPWHSWWRKVADAGRSAWYQQEIVQHKSRQPPPPCHRCDGKCCTTYDTLVLEYAELRALWSLWRWGATVKVVHNFTKLEWHVALSEKRCPALTVTNRCGIHDQRPLACRAFNCRDGLVEGGGGCGAYWLTLYPEWAQKLLEMPSN